jgi:hypothetical protein
MGHYAVPPVMGSVVVQDQLIGMLGHFGQILRCLPVRVNHALGGCGLSASAHTHQDPPDIQIRIIRRNEEHFRRVTCCFGFVQQFCVHTNVFDGKRTTITEKWALLIPHGGNERREGFLQVGFIESCLAGAQRSRDDEQCWLLLAQGVIPSCSVLCGPYRGPCLKFAPNFVTGYRSPSGVTFTVVFRFRSYS